MLVGAILAPGQRKEALDTDHELTDFVRPRVVMSTRPVLTFEMYRVVTFSHSLRQDVERLHE